MPRTPRRLVRTLVPAAVVWFIALMIAGLAAALDPRLTTINDWLYVLQPENAADIDAITASDFDVVVMDYSSDGSASGEFSAAQISALRASGKVVLSYLSIGEAETYRYYWDPTWNDDPAPDPDAPAWLGPFNPSFPDNYKVRYWDAGWQAILFGTPGGGLPSYLDRILAQGFDGIYLDIIDAFYFWSETQGEVTRQQARLDMIDLVEALAGYARQTPGFEAFLLVPQNGLDVVIDDDDLVDAAGQSYLATIDAVGVEDLFYNETAQQPPSEVEYREMVLDHYQDSGGDQRVVFLVDYVFDVDSPAGSANVARYNDFHSRARAGGYLPYAAAIDRALDEVLVVAADGAFAASQPEDGPGIFADGFDSGTTAAWSASVP